MSSRSGLGEMEQCGSLWWHDAEHQLPFHRLLPAEGETVTQQHSNAPQGTGNSVSEDGLNMAHLLPLLSSATTPPASAPTSLEFTSSASWR